jgi:hypothetical protein
MVLSRSWPVLCDELIGHYVDVLESYGLAATERTAVAA